MVKQTYFLKYSLTYRSPISFYLQSSSGINYLLTYFIPSFCPYHPIIEIVAVLFSLYI